VIRDFKRPNRGAYAHLLGIQSRVCPCLPHDLGRRMEAVGVSQEKLQELELAVASNWFSMISKSSAAARLVVPGGSS
jgi:hypothetical protein